MNQTATDTLASIFSSFTNYQTLDVTMPTVGLVDILDIVIVAFLIYKMIFWIKQTRAWVLFKGMVEIFGFALVAMILHLTTIL